MSSFSQWRSTSVNKRRVHSRLTTSSPRPNANVGRRRKANANDLSYWHNCSESVFRPEKRNHGHNRIPNHAMKSCNTDLA